MRESGTEQIIGKLAMLPLNPRISASNLALPDKVQASPLNQKGDSKDLVEKESHTNGLETVSTNNNMVRETGKESQKVNINVKANVVSDQPLAVSGVEQPSKNGSPNLLAPATHGPKGLLTLPKRPPGNNSIPDNSALPTTKSASNEEPEDQVELPQEFWDDFEHAESHPPEHLNDDPKTLDKNLQTKNIPAVDCEHPDDDAHVDERGEKHDSTDSQMSEEPELEASKEEELNSYPPASYPFRAASASLGKNKNSKDDLNQTSQEDLSNRISQPGRKIINPVEVGECFANIQELEKRIHKCGKENCFHFKRRDSKPYKGEKKLDGELFPKQMILFTCRHYGKPQPTGKGIRNNQKYLKTNCPCQVRCILDEEKEQYVVQSVCLKHVGHETTVTSYQWDTFERRLNEDQQVQFVDNSYTFLGARPSRVVKQIAMVTNKKTTAQDLINYANKRKSGAGKSDQDELMDFLETRVVENPNDSVVLYTSEETSDGRKTGDVLRSIFVQTKEMKQYFQAYPEVIHVDSCHIVLSNNYCVTVYSVIDHAKKGKMIGFSIMSGESADIHEASLASLLECNPKETVDKILHLVLDKSFAEMRAGSNLLQNVSFILCRFHVEQAFIRKLNTCHFGPDGGKDLKDLIRKQFKNMIFAESKTKYDECFELIKKAASEEEKVKANSAKAIACKTMVTYITDHWHPICDLFSYHLLKNQLTLGSYTNNIAENRFMRLKRHIERETTMVKVTKALLSLSEDDVLKTEEDLHRMNNSTYQPSNLNDDHEKQLVKVAGRLVDKTVVDLLLNQYRLSKSSQVQSACTWQKDSIECSKTDGKCSFACNYDLPCKHVFANRMYQGEDILTEPMIGQRWMPMKQEKGIIRKGGITNEKFALQKCQDIFRTTCFHFISHLHPRNEPSRKV